MSNFMNRMVSPGAWDVSVIVVWLLVVLVIVALGVLLYRLLAEGASGAPGLHGTRRAHGGGDAVGSLERRYAAGQIDDEEFERRRETILAGRERSG